mmetsp:Transcript_89826/g.209230  ORF Transcript_89826/g.209230 Transcript_89826/m.209230 type:complete len:253 (-) Transcript_89826:51-809(-)
MVAMSGAFVVSLLILAATLEGCGKSQRLAPTPSAPIPTPGPPPPLPPAPSPPPPPPACLCIFDIDRTLTGKQNALAECPANALQSGVSDSAYGGGTLTLSALAQSLDRTACAPCYIGTISAGDASGPGSQERSVLRSHLAASPGRLPTQEWSLPSPVTSPLVTSCPDTTKQTVVPGLLDWYKGVGVEIDPAAVHFFDDRADNVRAFQGTPYNARQISCATRDLGGVVGKCGATLAEIVLELGVHTCDASTFA